MKRQKDKQTKRENEKKTKDKRQSPKREIYIVTSGQFRTLAMFSHWVLKDMAKRLSMTGLSKNILGQYAIHVIDRAKRSGK